MLACALIMNKQLEGVGKALYKLKNIKQVLAKIMYQTLMHSQTSQSTSTRWLEPQPRASQVREVMNVDSQTKDRTFALCGFRAHFWNPFFFSPIQSQAKTWQMSPHESSSSGACYSTPAEELCEATVLAGLHSKKTRYPKVHVVFELALSSCIQSALEAELRWAPIWMLWGCWLRLSRRDGAG